MTSKFQRSQRRRPIEPLIQLDYGKWSSGTHTQPRGPPPLPSISKIRRLGTARPLAATLNNVLPAYFSAASSKNVSFGGPRIPPKVETRAMPHLPSTKKRTDRAHARPSHTAASVGKKGWGRGNGNNFRSERVQKRMPGFVLIPTWQPGTAVAAARMGFSFYLCVLG